MLIHPLHRGLGPVMQHAGVVYHSSETLAPLAPTASKMKSMLCMRGVARSAFPDNTLNPDGVKVCPVSDRSVIRKPLSDARRAELARLKDMARNTRRRAGVDEPYLTVAGVDEVGTGCIAGPVVACAVVLPGHMRFEGLNDSKRISPRRRADISKNLCGCKGVYYALSIVDVKTIDELNVLNARLLGLREAAARLWRSCKQDVLLVDGHMELDHTGPNIGKQVAVVGGDGECDVIAAASIIAKETRDKIMKDLHLTFPNYGFGDHKGYATRKHLRALRTYGACPIHRTSFRPVKEALDAESVGV